MLYAKITAEDARNAADYLNDIGSEPDASPGLVRVAEALYALSNDTDFIVTDEAVVPKIGPAQLAGLTRLRRSRQ